ncbi:hypothetical protein HBH1_02076 [Herbaspirillum sp. BH-1]|uniref:hypothetical protein n=1 Tax=Herbaspirillum sp. (strain BH-1) TaxID=2058884 RepID=UPI000C884981|nr:hypothetical protein [Herbaspirillum sp. BH-1]PLY59566.1 hypothetical protein HBH1_02076 [Herbaspirillum sp. BH-1]
MSLIPLRIDFVDPETHCARLADNGRIHGFKSGKATFILHESDGREYPYGPICAPKMMGGRELLRGIPDFTTRDFSPVQEDEDEVVNGNGLGGGKRPPDDSNDDEKAQAFAKRYLMLRMDRVANLPGVQPGVQYAPLAAIYEEFKKTRQLAPDAVRYIIAVERTSKTPEMYRSDNLLDVYTAYVQINRFIKTLKQGDFLDIIVSIRDNTLLRKLYLKPKQVKAAKLNLHPRAFQWAVAGEPAAQ